MASVHSLPNELLAHIFQLGFNNFSSDFGRDRTRYRFLLTVTAICARWRNVGISCPSLWSSIGIRIPTGFISKTTLERIGALLERSKDVSLDVEIYTMPLAEDDSMKKVKAILGPHLQRCRSVQLFVQRDDFRMVHVLFPLPGRMERLVDIAIDLRPIVHRGLVPSGLPRKPRLELLHQENASSLASLSLTGILRFLRTVIDVENVRPGALSVLIVDFTATLARPLRLLEIYSATLSHLKLYFSNIKRPSTPIHLPHLKLLETTQQCLDVIQQVINCPREEELTLHHNQVRLAARLPTTKTAQTLLRIWTNLRILDMPVTLSDNPAFAILAATPNITTLIEPHARFIRPLMPLCTLLIDNPSLIPKLQLLRITPPQWRPSTTRGGRSVSEPSHLPAQDLQALWLARPSLRVHYLKGSVDLGGLSHEAFEELAHGRFPWNNRERSDSKRRWK